ncbi:hypothetical protein [Granulicella mallensis]|uniref:hypothetical protein n=1 Tax=Granulicella mallensis TaxID=940614 RepID=UPI00167F603F|nr:hypothetical protein [Granulicella mallensis]
MSLLMQVNPRISLVLLWGSKEWRDQVQEVRRPILGPLGKASNSDSLSRTPSNLDL